MTIADTLLRLAARPEGVGSGEVPGASRQSALTIATRLVQRGELFLARISRRNSRFFTRIECAAAAERTHTMPSVQVKDTSVDWKNTETVTPQGVKVTVGPSPPQRFTALSEFHPLLRHRAR